MRTTELPLKPGDDVTVAGKVKFVSCEGIDIELKSGREICVVKDDIKTMRHFNSAKRKE